ncbi:MAG: hypothetical protein GY931_06180 [Maribacter sp.]|nr:hypothetical protein [Maribacter sp.]
MENAPTYDAKARGCNVVLPVEINKSYFFRTVTYASVGKVASVDGDFITLTTASWIADTGRFYNCLTSGNFLEVEPYPDGVTINSQSIVDFSLWPHPLPTKQKPS